MNEHLHGAMTEQHSHTGPVPTTTHAEWGAGHPRLLVTREPDERFVYDLTADLTTIGSSSASTLVLTDIDPSHASIHHDDRDEYVLTMIGDGTTNANLHVDPVSRGEDSEIMLSGAQFTAGPWRFVFQRDEFADHGRPHGGREGGWASWQKSQPPRPSYAHGETEAPKPA